MTIDYAIDLHLVADLTNAQLAEIVALNPSLLRMSTPHDLSFDLHIPAGTREAYATRVKEIPEDKRSSWRFHVVRAGESLDTIAAALHARAAEIAETNEIKQGESLDDGDELVVPCHGCCQRARPALYGAARRHVDHRGGPVSAVSVEDLRQLESSLFECGEAGPYLDGGWLQ